MIVQMSKVKIIGPSAMLDEVLSFLMTKENLQIEKENIVLLAQEKEAKSWENFCTEKSAFEKTFSEGLKKKIEELFSMLPVLLWQKRYLNPKPVLNSIAKLLDKHLASVHELSSKKELFIKEKEELQKQLVILETLKTLQNAHGFTKNFEYIGISLKKPEYENELRQLLEKTTGGYYEFSTTLAPDGSTVGLILIDKNLSKKVRETLSSGHIPEHDYSNLGKDLSLSERFLAANKKIEDLNLKIKNYENEILQFAKQWGSIYNCILEYIRERLTILKAYFCIFHSKMCFFIFGWINTKEIQNLSNELKNKFEEKIVLEETEVKTGDLNKTPVLLQNPPYFKPFEIFTRILPLPLYTSYDPTPFIGIFFPIFFGIILGDAGYGFIIFLLSLFLSIRFKNKNFVSSAAKIFMISSVYTVIFGVLYGEYFGDIGHKYWGLKSLWIERQFEIIPMMFFAISIGIAHVLLGLILGLIKDIKNKAKSHAAIGILNIILIILVTGLIVSLFGFYPEVLKGPLITAIIILIPVLIIAGGFLAPLELLKNFGNIISYTRIMALGLSSVLLAQVANQFSGLTGNVVTGVLIAVLIHLLNIVLGMFSPAIHSLRLHYVEFFSKFVETGGKEFKPFKKEE
ncbi:MAG: ATPase [Spirochaetia bacterium]|nr:ATPase [Spirochaetia bacterium]